MVFSTPPDVLCTAGPLAAWYTSPAGSVVQLTEAAVFSKAMAEWLVGPGYDQLLQRFPHARDMSLVLDLHAMVSREPAARPIMMAAATKYLSTPAFARIGVIAPAKPPPLYMTTLRGAIALVSALGPEVRLYDTLGAALEHLQLRHWRTAPDPHD